MLGDWSSAGVHLAGCITRRCGSLEEYEEVHVAKGELQRAVSLKNSTTHVMAAGNIAYSHAEDGQSGARHARWAVTMSACYGRPASLAPSSVRVAGRRGIVGMR